MNKAPLLILLLMLCVGSLRGQRMVYHIARETRLTDTIVTFYKPSDRPVATLLVRAALVDPARQRPGLSPASLDIGAGEWTLRVQTLVTIDDDIDDGRTLCLSLFRADSLVDELSCLDLAHPVGGYNTFQLDWAADSLRVSAGRGSVSQRLCVEATPPADRCSLRATGSVKVALLMTEEQPETASERLAGLSPEEIARVLNEAREGSPAGYYYYLDREADPAVARLGGRYRLAVVPDSSFKGGFLILYLSGAEVDTALWKPGMIKGRLRPTPFSGQYDLQWYDAHGNAIPGADDSFAIYDRSTQTLSLRFPILEASLRFAAQ